MPAAEQGRTDRGRRMQGSRGHVPKNHGGAFAGADPDQRRRGERGNWPGAGKDGKRRRGNTSLAEGPELEGAHAAESGMPVGIQFMEKLSHIGDHVSAKRLISVGPDEYRRVVLVYLVAGSYPVKQKRSVLHMIGRQDQIRILE